MKPLLFLFTAPERRGLWRAVLALLVATITVLALSPAPPASINTGWDKLNHALAFAALAFAGVWALWPQPRRWGALSVLLMAYGGAIEIVQGMLPTRQADGMDMLADGVGVVVGLATAWALLQLAHRVR